ncbi:MAG: hypothetical protein JNM93_12570 [Bacteriovoracaceae bacterium]|nr:hypothetical protein [Bacteriovoracaceae bacterium]
MKILILLTLIVLTFSIGKAAEPTQIPLVCSQIAFDMVSKKLLDVEEQNQYIRGLNRLDKSLSEFSKKEADQKSLVDFRSIAPVFDHKVDVMTINYMSKVVQMLDEQKDQQKQVQIMQIALTNLSLQYNALIPEFMKKCGSMVSHDREACANAKNETDKLNNCYNGNEQIVSWVENTSPYFKAQKTI